MSRQPFEPTQKQRENVEILIGLMVPQEVVAHLLEIDAKTLRKHFRVELDHGHARTVSKLKAIIFGAARSGSIRASCYLLDRMNVWPIPENGAAQQQQQPMVIRVVGGAASVLPAEMISKPTNGAGAAE